MDTFGIKNYNSTLQLANTNTSNVNTNKVQNIASLNSATHSITAGTNAADVVDTSALFVITPDGTTHRKAMNSNGEVEYLPSITLDSFKNSKVRA